MFYAFTMLLLGYLSGSVNYAIVVTRLATGKDIRTLGNQKPGTANVGRNVGKGWAALVFALDVGKGLGPMFLSRRLFFSGSLYWEAFIVAAVGMAAILGHCKPVFFRFRGGGGIATSIGVFSFFVPAELLLSMLVGFAVVMLFLRRVRFRFGQWIPIVFVPLIPLLTLVLSVFVELPLAAWVGLGGHPWFIVVIVFALTLFVAGMNLPFLLRRLWESRVANRDKENC